MEEVDEVEVVEVVEVEMMEVEVMGGQKSVGDADMIGTDR